MKIDAAAAAFSCLCCVSKKCEFFLEMFVVSTTQCVNKGASLYSTWAFWIYISFHRKFGLSQRSRINGPNSSLMESTNNF